MTKPAIVHIITRLDLGGAQKSCLSLIKELQEKYPNFEIYLISGIKGPLVNQAKQLKNVHLLDTMLWEINPKNTFIEIKNFLRIIRFLKEKNKIHPQLIVHTHTIKAGLIGRWAALFAGIKTRIHTIHGFGFNPYQNKLIWFTFYLIELINSMITTHFICVSSVDQKSGTEIFPNFKNKNSIIRAATIDKQKYKPAKKEQLSFKIGTIACLKEGKNLFDLLKTVKNVKKVIPNIKLEIIGDGTLKSALKEHILKNNLNNNVSILGWQKDPVKYAKNWDLFIFTSLWEGLPCAIIETLDIKVPIISYNVGGIPDIINKSKLHHKGNWQNLTHEITEFYNKKHHKEFYNVPNEFYISNMLKKHADLYQKKLNPMYTNLLNI